MSRLRRIFDGTLRSAIEPYSKTRSFQSYASSFRHPRSSSYILPTESGNGVSITSNRQCRSFVGKQNGRIFPLTCLAGNQLHKSDPSASCSTRSLNSTQSFNSGYNRLLFGANAVFFSRTYSSHAGKQNDHLNAIAETSQSGAHTGGNEWTDILNHACQSAGDAAASVGNKAKELSDSITPHIHQLYHSYPYLEKVVVPVGWTLSGTMVAWFLMPRILRKIHKYASKGPFASLYWWSSKEPISYDKSMWSALEDPVRYLITFMAFSQLGAMVAPATSEYLPQAWRGAAVLSFIWFLSRWKANFFSRALAKQVTVGLDQDKLMTLDKLSSVSLLIFGVMGLAEACGVAVQSILTVGGIGGVATAFAARDILGNLLSGLSVQFSRPFSVGDTIKAGSIEGQVVEMGLTTTSLLNPEEFPVIVPNSLFSSQAIINKSRAQWRASFKKIPVRISDLQKIPLLSEEIKSMLRSNPNVHLEKEAPYCYLSRIENSFAELTLRCNIKNMGKDALFTAEQDILLQVAKIIEKHGAELANFQFDSNSQ